MTEDEPIVPVPRMPPFEQRYIDGCTVLVADALVSDDDVVTFVPGMHYCIQDKNTLQYTEIVLVTDLLVTRFVGFKATPKQVMMKKGRKIRIVLPFDFAYNGCLVGSEEVSDRSTVSILCVLPPNDDDGAILETKIRRVDNVIRNRGGENGIWYNRNWFRESIMIPLVLNFVPWNPLEYRIKTSLSLPDTLTVDMFTMEYSMDGLQRLVVEAEEAFKKACSIMEHGWMPEFVKVSSSCMSEILLGNLLRFTITV